MLNKQEVLTLLKSNVVPALGCTEPVCVALAAADAVQAIGGDVKGIKMTLSRNVYKNGVSVGIANFPKVGLEYAAALGAYIAERSHGLEIMAAITPVIAEKAIALVEQGVVEITVDPEAGGVYLHCTVETDRGTAVSVIQGGHTNIVLTQVNGETVFESQAAMRSGGVLELVERLKEMTVAEIRAVAASCTEEELEFLWAGAEMNQTLASYGIDTNCGIGISGVLTGELGQKLMGSGLLERIMIRVASATEARLEGCPLATMSSAGSGSKGIATILPVVETAAAIGASRAQTLQALAFAHLMNEYGNAHVGKLSAICACAMAAAPAASAAITWLLGGGDTEISYAIRNMSGSITGMICDGGKVGCSLKLATAMGAAIMSACMAMGGVALRPSDGICGYDAESSIHNMSRISNPGMTATDREILNIMLEKNEK